MAVLALRARRSAGLALALAFVSACGGTTPSDGLGSETSLYAVVTTIDGTYFSPPLGPAPSYSGSFDPTLLARLEVRLEGLRASGELAASTRFDPTTSPALRLVSEHETYFVNVPAAAYFLDASLAYRFRVLLDGREIARSDLSAVVFDVLRTVPNLLVGVKLRIETRPQPVIAALSPSRTLATSPAFTLTVNGAGFAGDSVVHFGGHALDTTKVSSTVLTAVVPAPYIATAQSYDVVVTTPAPGGGSSATATFVADNPVPVLTQVAPTYTTAEGAGLELTLYGLSFAPGATASLDGVALATTWVSATELRANVPAAGLALARVANVAVQNPPPAGGTSGNVAFTVANVVPTLSALTPAHATRGTGNVLVTLEGAGFVSGAHAAFDGATLATDFVSRTRLVATVPSTNLGAAGYHTITVANATPNLGTSAGLLFTIDNGAPTLATVTPASTMRTIGVTITVDGAGFVSGAQASLGATALSTTYVSAARLTAVVPSAVVSAVGQLALTVMNPAPTTGASGSITFGVTELYNCTNGIRDGQETGVDCGGPYCPACIPLGSAPDHPAHSCSDILFSGASTGDGVYWIDADGGSTANAYATFCDMTTDGGGWTLVAYAGNNTAGFPRMDVDTGSWSPALRNGKASKSAVDVVHRSNQMALGYSPALSHSGALGGMSDVVAFSIPSPKAVDLTTSANAGTCTAVDAWRLRPVGSTAACVGDNGSTSGRTASSTTNCNPQSGASHAGVWSRSLGGTYGGVFAYGLYTTEYTCNSWPNISHHWWVDSQYYNWEPSATQPWNGSVNGSTSIWVRCSANGACPTCDDGVQNQSEDGVDCGGPCAPCGPLNTQAEALATCSDILLAGASHGDGLYWIAPSGNTASAYLTHCDMTTDGGGWTLAAYAGSNAAGFPRMDVDVSPFDPAHPTGKGSHGGVSLVHRSREMALGYSPDLNYAGSLADTTDAVTFVIPSPNAVDLQTSANRGQCVPVSARRLRPLGSNAACMGNVGELAISEFDCNPRSGTSHTGMWSTSLGGTYNGNFAYGIWSTDSACNNWPYVSHHWWVDNQYYNWEPSATQPWSGTVNGSTSVWMRGDVFAATCHDGQRDNGETGVDCGGSCAACPTCLDGIRNQDETAVDCGGVCGPCPFNAQSSARTSCTDILLANESQGDGIYWVDPDGGSSTNAFKTYCDMTTDGGGWTLTAYAGSNDTGFPRMDQDVGDFHPWVRTGKASRSAVLLARGSTEMALAYASATDSHASLGQSNDVVSFTIPDPASVDLSTTNSGVCTAVVAKRLRPVNSTAACVGSSGMVQSSAVNCSPSDRTSHAGVFSRSLGGTYSGAGFGYGLFTTEYGCNSWPSVSHHFFVNTSSYNWQPSSSVVFPSTSNGATSIWVRGDVSSALNTRATALATCKAIRDAGGARGDGVYFVDPDGGSTTNAYKTYCDMTTDGGGWTLVGYAGSREGGFPRMDSDTGTFTPLARVGKAAKSAVTIARASTEIALGYSGSVEHSGSLGALSDVVAFNIPNPAIVDFAPTANNGTCTAVTARRLRPAGSTAACIGSSPATAISTSNCNPTAGNAHAGVWSRSLGGTYTSFAYGIFGTEWSCNSWPNVSHHWWVDSQYYNWEPSATQAWSGSVEGTTSIWLR